MYRETIIISPGRAKELLSTYTIGAKVNCLKVEKLKQKILSGTWREDNGSFINIRAGKLVNGKHRMNAIIEAGIEVKARVQYDN